MKDECKREAHSRPKPHQCDIKATLKASEMVYESCTDIVRIVYAWCTDGVRLLY